MKSPLTLIQISDVHIPASADMVCDVDARHNLLTLLKVFKQQTWDLLVVSGDLAALYGEIEAYRWLKQQLDALQRPYVIIAGNHDRRDTLSQVFTFKDLPVKLNHPIYYRYDIHDLPLLFLDTSDNTLSDNQIDWLKQQDQHLTQPALLFMHHPPIDCQCYFMDKRYPLLNRDAVWSQLKKLKNIQHIFCGHYHTAKRLYRDGKWIYICPSTMNQINPLNPNYSASDKTPAWRVIQWDGEQVWSRTYRKAVKHKALS